MRRYRITLGDKVFDVEIVAVRGDTARVLVNGRPYEARVSPAPGAPSATPRPAPAPVKPAPPPPQPEPAAPRAPEPAAVAGLGKVVLAPMPGSILEVLVKVGDRVQTGDTVVKLEAMKMENDVKTERSGVVSEVRVSKGSNVAKGEVLLVVSES